MKKISMMRVMAVVLAIGMVAVFSFIGCKTTTVETTAAETTAAETTVAETTAAETTATETTAAATGKKQLVYITPCINISPDWNVANATFLDKCKEYGYIGQVVGTNDATPELMIEYFEIAISNGVDGICNCPLVPEQFKAVYGEALAAKIPVVDVAIDSGFEAVISAVTTNAEQHGTLAAEKIIEKSGGKAKLLIESTPESENQEIAITAFMKAIEGSDITVIDRFFSGTGFEEINNSTLAALQAYPECDFIWCVDGYGPYGASFALQELGLIGKVTVLAVDMQPQCVEDMEAGIIWASFEQNFHGWGGTPVDLLKDYWDGKDVPRFVDAGLTFWEKATLADFYATHKTS